jgi:hypothetical protein
MAETAPTPIDYGTGEQQAAQLNAAAQELTNQATAANELVGEKQEWTRVTGVLDDAAEARIYGSRGATLYGINPDGTPNTDVVVADAEHPMPSRADAIMSDSTIDPNPNVRARMARGYMKDFERYREKEGLSLFQAEQLAEDRLADRKQLLEMTTKFMIGGEVKGRYDETTGKRTPDNTKMEYEEARARALKIYKRKDDHRLHEAKMENPFTRGDEEARVAADKAARKGNRDEMLADAAKRKQSKDFGRNLAKLLAQAKKPNSNPPAPTRSNRQEVSDDVWRTAHAENERFNRIMPDLEQNHDRRLSDYARVTAEARSGHLGRLEQGGGRVRRALRALHVVRNVQSERTDRTIDTARNDHLQALQDYERVYRQFNGSPRSVERRLLQGRLDDQVQLGREIAAHRQTYARNADANGRVSLFNRAAARIGTTWTESGRGRVFKVALPAVVLGAGAGAAAAAFAPGVLATAAIGLGATYAGRKLGHGVSRAENRRAVLDPDRAARYRQMDMDASRADQIMDIEAFLNTGNTAENLDHTQAIENVTTAQIQANRRNRTVDAAIGAAAAGLAFGATNAGLELSNAFGNGANAAQSVPGAHSGTNGTSSAASNGSRSNLGPVGNGNNSIGQYLHPKGTGTAGAPPNLPPAPHAAVTPNHVTAPGSVNPNLNINPNQYPWTVADKLTPGHAMPTIQHAANILNQRGGYNLHLVPQPDGTVWLENGGHALNAAQQEIFNRFMEAVTTAS